MLNFSKFPGRDYFLRLLLKTPRKTSTAKQVLGNCKRMVLANGKNVLSVHPPFSKCIYLKIVLYETESSF